MALSVIIVNYRSSDYISNCIKSALQFDSAKDFEWIVVDNASNDNSKDHILSQFPFVKWIDMGYNAGFARANNEGIRQSEGETVLLLNPDMIIQEDAISFCYSQLLNSSYIASSVQLLNPDLTPQITGSFYMAGGLNHLLPLPYMGDILRAIAFGMKVKKTNIQDIVSEQKVDWINGAFIMAKKEAIDKAGMLDEDFFLYSEEIEWCYRLGKVGNLCVFGNLHSTHLQGETVNKEIKSKEKGYKNLFDIKGRQLIVSQMVRIRKQFGIAWCLFHFLMYLAEIPFFAIVSVIHHLVKFDNPFSDWKRISGYTINIMKLGLLLPVILRNKPHFYKIM